MYLAADKPEDFVPLYEAALAKQRWDAVEHLIHEDACVTFSDGRVMRGKATVQQAYETNFAAIQNEAYRISNLYWINRGPESAVYLFEFSWTGLINGQPASGSGRGTSVLCNGPVGWQLLVEHLGPAPTEA